MGLRGGGNHETQLEIWGDRSFGALSLVVSGALAQAAPSGPDPSEGPISGGTKVTLSVPVAPSEGSLAEVGAAAYHSLGLDTHEKA